MSKPYCYEYPRPAVTVDLVGFTMRQGALCVLLIRRKSDPFVGQWAIPGGFLDIEERVEAGARREFQEETGVEPTGPLAPIGVFAEPGRDPRGRTISLAHATVFRMPGPDPQGADDASEAAWIDVAEIGPLAFDHEKILTAGLDWLRTSILAGPIGLALLPASFSSPDVHLLFRSVFGDTTGADAWRHRHERAGLLKPVGGNPGEYAACSEAIANLPRRGDGSRRRLASEFEAYGRALVSTHITVDIKGLGAAEERAG